MPTDRATTLAPAVRSSGPAGRGRPRPARSASRRRVNRLGLALVAPAFAVIALLVLYPSISSVIGSFQRYELTDPNRSFTGLRNYGAVLTDDTFLQSLLNTAGYFVVISLAVLLMGLGTALWLQSLRGAWRAVALTIIVLPWSVPGTVAGRAVVVHPEPDRRRSAQLGAEVGRADRRLPGVAEQAGRRDPRDRPSPWRGAPCRSVSWCCSPGSRASRGRSTSRASSTARPG